MKANYKVTGNDRKALVAAIENLTGNKAIYMRMPTCAYEIGDITVDKEGGVTCDDADKLERLIHNLIADGFTPEDTEEDESNDEATGLTVSLPLDKVAVGNLTNLLTAKERLIKKALGIDDLDIEVSEDTVSFPWFTEMPEPEEPDGAEDVSEILPAEESFPEEAEEAAEAEEPAEEPEAEEEYEYEEIETRRPVSGGRAFAAVVVTIPMLAVWVLLFGLSLALGIVVLAIGAALLAAGVYLTGYVFNGAIVRMPDLLLTAGATLAAFALALLLLWTGISIAVAGCTLTVRLTRSIYRAILYPKKEEDADE